MSDPVVDELRCAIAALDTIPEGVSTAFRSSQRTYIIECARAVLVHLEGEQQRIARAWDEGSEAQRTADVLGVQVFANPYRREEQTNG